MTIRRTMTPMTLTACLWACEEPEPGPGLGCVNYGLSARKLPIQSLSIRPCPIAPSSAIQEVRSATAYTTNANVVQAEVVAFINALSDPSLDDVAAAFDEVTRIVDAGGAEVAFGRGYDSDFEGAGDDATLTFRTSASLSQGVATIESSFLDAPLPFHAGADAAPFVHRIELAVRERRHVFVLTFSEPLDLGPGDVQVRSLGDEATEADEEWLRVRVAPAPMTRAYVVLDVLSGGTQ